MHAFARPRDLGRPGGRDQSGQSGGGATARVPKGVLQYFGEGEGVDRRGGGVMYGSAMREGGEGGAGMAWRDDEYGAEGDFDEVGDDDGDSLGLYEEEGGGSDDEAGAPVR